MKPALSAPRIHAAVQAVCCAFEIRPSELRGRSRRPVVDKARCTFYAALYAACETSYPEIGRVMYRDHTTVLSGVRRAARLAKHDGRYAQTLKTITQLTGRAEL